MEVKIGTALVRPTQRTSQEALAEVRRELDVRKRCFSRWVDDGKMSEMDAVDRYERMYSALVYLGAYHEQWEEAHPVNVALPTSAEGV